MFQIQYDAVECYNNFKKYKHKLKDYVVGAYLACLDDVIKTMTKKEVEAAILILTKLKKSLSP